MIVSLLVLPSGWTAAAWIRSEALFSREGARFGLGASFSGDARGIGTRLTRRIIQMRPRPWIGVGVILLLGGSATSPAQSIPSGTTGSAQPTLMLPRVN